MKETHVQGEQIKPYRRKLVFRAAAFAKAWATRSGGEGILIEPLIQLLTFSQ